MASDAMYGFGVGVALPFMALERIYAAPVGTGAPHPLSPGWHTVIHLWGAMANVGILVALIGGPLLARDALAVIRLMRGRCSFCGYILLKAQGRCPECGAERRRFF